MVMVYTEAREKASIIYNTECGTKKKVASHTNVVKTKRHKGEYYCAIKQCIVKKQRTVIC